MITRWLAANSDPKYGPQFDAKSVSYDLPETPEGLVQYLAKHPAFTGIGETTARKITPQSWLTKTRSFSNNF